MIVSLGLLVTGASLAIAGGVPDSIPIPGSGTPTTNRADYAQATNVQVTGAAAVHGINNNENKNKALACSAYHGDGTSSAGWPTISEWISFDNLWGANYQNIKSSCSAYNVADNSDEEMMELRAAINNVSAKYYVDHRYILAEIIQESTGCVRVPTTNVTSGSTVIYNPGLLQDYDGYYTCNCGGNRPIPPHEDCSTILQNPCPSNVIYGMVREGAVGTDSGKGLASLINIAESKGTSGAQTFYVASEWYNQGVYTPAVGQNLDTNTGGGGTNCYASDVAQRLVGCTAPVSCT